MKDVIKDTTAFYKTLDGDDYIGMRSDCESFLSTMQSNIYLTDFTLKEDIKRKLMKKLYESKTVYQIGSMSLNESQFKTFVKDCTINALRTMNLL